MAERNRTSERFAGVAVLAALLLNPPILSLFSVDATVFGIPLLFFYLFVAWALVIFLIAVSARHVGRDVVADGQETSRSEETSRGQASGGREAGRR